MITTLRRNRIPVRRNTIGAVVMSSMLVLLGGDAIAGGLSPADEPVRSNAQGGTGAEIAEGVVGWLVLSSSGHPVAGALITATSLDRPSKPVPEIAILTNADGRFAWPLRPGTYRLAAIVEGRELARATATVVPGRVTTLNLSDAP